MIRVTVELVPFGDENKAKVIGSMRIWNDLTGDREISNYGVSLTEESGKVHSKEVKNHIRQEGVWRLIRRALIEVGL